MKLIYSILALLAFTSSVYAQDSTATSDTAKKKKKAISISNHGITVGEETKNKDSVEKVVDLYFAMLDLGINYLDDKTNYNSAAVKDFLHVSPEMKNDNLFSLREGKSINVNVYPVMVKFRMLKTKHQKAYLSSGIGLQMYNFRFNRPITYINETVPMVVTDSIQFTKNKVGLTYLTVPLMITAKTKLAKGAWLVYGAGITAGYRIASWTKQVSEQRGKQKNPDQFNFNNFNSCVTAELGVEGYFRLYASYQLTSLHENILDQHPYCIGVRFMGI
jgi:hypothetical protein